MVDGAIVPAFVSLTGSGDFYLLQGPGTSVFGDTQVAGVSAPNHVTVQTRASSPTPSPRSPSAATTFSSPMMAVVAPRFPPVGRAPWTCALTHPPPAPVTRRFASRPTTLPELRCFCLEREPRPRPVRLGPSGPPVRPARRATRAPPGPRVSPGPWGRPVQPARPGRPGKVICRNTPTAITLCTVLFPPGSWTTAGATLALRATLSRGGRTCAVGHRHGGVRQLGSGSARCDH